MSSPCQVISRDCINSDLVLHIVDKNLTFEYKELLELIDRAKSYLINEINVQLGDQVIITFGNYYTPWFYACAELGLVFIIAASHKIPNYKELNERYGKIDHVILPFDKEDLVEFRSTYQDIAIDANIIKTYKDTSQKNIRWANNTSILTKSISEKYTQKVSADSIEEHSHEFYYRLLQRNGALFKITNNDRCMHTRILHHGSSLALFFLPSFKFCKNQFWCDDGNSFWPSYISRHNITRCIMFDDMMDNFIKYNQAPTLSLLKIYTILSPTDEQVNNVVVDKHASIVSLFGMTGTSGPIFLQEITYDTHQLYDRSVFSDVLDDFYKVKIESGKLVVQYDNKTVYTKDHFEYKNNRYHFLFRGNMIIGICGFIGSGKDTVSDYLVNFHGFRRESFASSLKDAVSAIFGWDRIMLEGRTAESRKWREEPDEWWSTRLNMTITPRFVLQNWGTEVLRHQFHPDIWIASVENKLRFSNDNIVITDCRFPNEIKAIKEAGGIVVRIKRGPDPDWYKFAYDANIGKSGAADKLKYRKIHESEMSWIGPNIDVTIENDGTIDELYQSIKDLVQDHLASK